MENINVKLPKLEQWQKDVLNEYIQHPKDRWVVTKSCRQTGKSVTATVLLIYASLSTPNSVSISVSPIAAQARKLFRDVKKMANELIEVANSSTLEIHFINQSVILFKGAESGDSLRGYTVKGGGVLVVDEGAFIPDDTFYEILVPTTNVGHNDIFIFSTPKYKRGFFYSLYEKGLSDDKIKSFDWTTYDLSKYLTPSLLEVYRSQLPKNAFRAEFEGQFLDDNGSVFSNFRSCIGECVLDKELPIAVGVDWATNSGGDSTVFTVVQKQNNKTVVLEQQSFNSCPTLETIERLLELIRRYISYGVVDLSIKVEKNSIGAVYFAVLSDKVDDYIEENNIEDVNIGCSTFITTNKSKERIIRNLCKMFEEQSIVLPPIDELMFELGVFECKINSNNTPIYSAPSPYHDDRVMSLAIAVECGEYI